MIMKLLIACLKNNVRHTIFGYEIPPQWYLNFDTLLIIIFSPVIAQFFQYLQKKGIIISTAKKFSFGLLAIALSYLLMYLGIKKADQSGFITINWIFLYYLLQSIGELLIAPTGYAMVGQLASQRLQGIMMGTWMMVCGVATIFSHYVSNAMTIENTNNPLITNSNFLHVFGKLGLYAMVSGSLLFLVSKKINSFIETDDFIKQQGIDQSSEIKL